MPRVKLQALTDADYPHQTRLSVRVTDLNYGNHLGNDALVGMLHEARVQFLASHGASELDLGDGATGIIQTDLALNYQAECRLADPLVIDTACIERSRAGFRLAQRVRRNDADRTLVALAETGFLAYDYAANKRGRLPATFLAAQA